KRGLATAVARTTIEVAGLLPSKPPMGFFDRLWARLYLEKARPFLFVQLAVPASRFAALHPRLSVV
ncbi:MAG: hypothetical protein Q4C35_04795, partial [Eubacteriales bacterium]|nr:hypothetical protein [Eubacteriales bacterium]